MTRSGSAAAGGGGRGAADVDPREPVWSGNTTARALVSAVIRL